MKIREKILHAAARVYAESGYRGATTRRIAREAGVNEITLFRHFGTKDVLLHEAIESAGTEEPAAALPESPQRPRQELMEWARAHLAALRAQGALIRTCLGERNIARSGSAPAAATHRLARYLDRLRTRGLARDDFDPGTAAALLTGALFADALGRTIMPDMYRNDPEEALREYLDLFLRAIGADLEESTE
jgi:AcrR family transcriptional regulator